MKAELIADIITAHCSGDEQKFKAAIDALAADEEKKETQGFPILF